MGERLRATVGRVRGCLARLSELSSHSNRFTKRAIFPVMAQLGSEFSAAVGLSRQVKAYLNLCPLLCAPFERVRDELDACPAPESGGAEQICDTYSPFERTPVRLVDAAAAVFRLDGFCPACLAQGGRLEVGSFAVDLLRCRADNEFYILCSRGCLNAFLAEPQDVLSAVEEVKKKCFWLPFLLERQVLQRRLFYLGTLDRQDTALANMRREVGVQTPLVFADAGADTDHCWNEWDLRREALQLHNIRKKQTTSVQTTVSVFKTDAETQTWGREEASTMTGAERGTNPMWPRNYILGLRAAPDSL